MKNYRVLWEIDVEAESPEAAAKKAREAQHPDTYATVFTCYEMPPVEPWKKPGMHDTLRDGVVVDLDLIDEQ